VLFRRRIIAWNPVHEVAGHHERWPTTRSFDGRVRELVQGHPTLLAVADALLLTRAVLGAQLGKLQKRLVSLARDNRRTRLLMSPPGVSVLVALTTSRRSRRSDKVPILGRPSVRISAYHQKNISPERSTLPGGSRRSATPACALHTIKQTTSF
jgi:hypothetical protein